LNINEMQVDKIHFVVNKFEEGELTTLIRLEHANSTVAKSVIITDPRELSKGERFWAIKSCMKKMMQEQTQNCHYYRLIFHYRHFHCRSDRSDGVILPPLVGPIGRPRREGNQLLKLLPPTG
jgi:hypothetical protein